VGRRGTESHRQKIRGRIGGIWVGIKGGEWCEGRRGNIEGQERVGEGEEGK
jgi:hypothetical protein